MDTQNILVTGAGSGFGLLISRSLAENGHTVFAGIRDPEGRNKEKSSVLKSIDESSKGNIHVLEMDVTDEHSISTAVQAIYKTAGTIDVVVNNAGIGGAGWLETFPPDQFEKIFNVNVLGVQRVNRAVLPEMRKNGRGLLIHISSLLGRIIMPFTGPYTASKFALEGLAENYHYELKDFGIESIIVEPGGFGTDFATGMIAARDTDRKQSYGPAAEAPKKMWEGFAPLLQGENAPNPQDVADAVFKLIETPAGSRPLRTVVDTLMGGAGVPDINEVTDKIQKQMAESQSH